MASKEDKPFYHSKVWYRLRTKTLMRDLYTCSVPGCGKPAHIVDHIIGRAAGGADTLENLRALCREHDNQLMQRKSTGERMNEGVAKVRGCFADGSPRDPNHPWYTGGPVSG